MDTDKRESGQMVIDRILAGEKSTRVETAGTLQSRDTGRESTVQLALQNQGQALDAIHQMIGRLDEKLIPILRGSNTPSNETLTSPSPVPSSVIGIVDLHTQLVILAVKQLDNLIRRVEL